MLKWSELIEQNAEEIAALDTIDGGKLFSWCKAVDVPEASNILRYYAGAADKIHGDVFKTSRNLHLYSLMEPVGVVGHIIPWNFPTVMFFAKVAPAWLLAAPWSSSLLSKHLCHHSFMLIFLSWYG